MSTKKKELIPILVKSVGPLTFGMFMRVTRERMEITQAEMAKKLGMARGTLCDIEKGRQLVSPDLAIKIARKLDLPERMAVGASLQDVVNKLKLKVEVKLEKLVA
jgi:DNA-binding XRE family transcriptional regulator